MVTCIKFSFYFLTSSYDKRLLEDWYDETIHDYELIIREESISIVGRVTCSHRVNESGGKVSCDACSCDNAIAYNRVQDLYPSLDLTSGVLIRDDLSQDYLDVGHFSSSGHRKISVYESKGIYLCMIEFDGESG